MTATTAVRGSAKGRATRRSSGTEFYTTVEMIGPELAREYLDMMPRNRRRRIRLQTRFATAIKKGQWKLTGESIKFNTKGELIDGQHRLEAVIEANKAIEILVCRNVPPSAFMELDTGGTRSPGDLLTVAGYNYTNSVASTIRYLTSILRIEGDQIGPSSLAHERVDPKTLLEYANTHGEELTAAVTVTNNKQARVVLGPPSMYAALYYIFAEHNKKGADVFFETLISGCDYEQGRVDPVYQLHRLLVQYKQDKHSKRPNFYKCAIAIKAWNAFQMRDTISSLRFSESEGWPEINRRKVRVTEVAADARNAKKAKVVAKKEKAKTAAKKKAGKLFAGKTKK